MWLMRATSAITSAELSPKMPITIIGFSVIVVISESLDPITPATTPVSSRPANIHTKTRWRKP